MIAKLLTEHHLKFLSLKGGCRGSSESTIVKMSNLLEISGSFFIDAVNGPRREKTGLRGL